MPSPHAAELNLFHPVIQQWFTRFVGEPTAVQCAAWAAIAAHQTTLIAAPTGSGKTLAAFLAIINELLQLGIQGQLAQQTYVLYISPLKALSNDIQKNLQLPLNGIRDQLLESGIADVSIQAWVRTGDTSQAERQRMRRQAPHILVTTPESLYVLLGSASGREMLRHVRSVIVDEIHALAGNKRGAHLLLSLERLSALCESSSGICPTRIGISATQKPIALMANFLQGTRDTAVNIIDIGHSRERDLRIELPRSPLQAVMANEVWDEMYDRLAELIAQHRTTLIFVNTRRLAERAAHHLAQRLGEHAVTAHHGSLARKHRLHAEQRLKAGELRGLVCTASLELGIDIGDIDLVCQLGSPRAIATFLQRVGRSGHSIHGTPKGLLFPLSRDDLVECTALFAAIQRDELDAIQIPEQPLDVLAQQIVAEVAAQHWNATALYEQFRRTWSYRNLSRASYDAVLRMLVEGYSTRRGRRGAYLFHDRVQDELRTRPGARLVAILNGGAIPDQFDYDVILQPEAIFVGSLNEDFAFESIPGDIFQLGNTSYRILKIEQGRVLVEDAHGQPPNIPFWFGESPGRTNELSQAVSQLRSEISPYLDNGLDATLNWLQTSYALAPAVAQQLAEYLGCAKAALGVLPTLRDIIFERFFDDTGDMHLVIHSTYGTRVNRAWGLALRKRFCRKFNFELQASATDNHIILSLGPTHSFPLDEVVNYLHSNSVRSVLIQALLAAPMFATRWRWNTNISLAVLRLRNGKRVPAQFQRSDAEDLIALVFPDQLACLENIVGDREVPDHPLVQQTLHDCLHDTMDITALEQLYQQIAAGEVRVHCRDLTGPSPLTAEILTARPYAFLDDGAAEERRTHNVKQSPQLDLATARQLGRLNPEAVAQIQQDAWPQASNVDELHDAIVMMGFITEQEVIQATHFINAQPNPDNWPTLIEDLLQQGRITRVTHNNQEDLQNSVIPANAGIHITNAIDSRVRGNDEKMDVQSGSQTFIYVAAERLADLFVCLPHAIGTPAITPLTSTADNTTGLLALLRSRLEYLGPVTAEQLAQPLGISVGEITSALLQLEQQGFVIQGRFNTPTDQTQWCERRLLARIHRAHQQQRRREIEPVSPQDFMRFLFDWQHVAEPRQGVDALLAAMEQLEGLPLPASAWENEILPMRVQPYHSTDLDQLCNSGRLHWQRVLNSNSTARKSTVLRTTPIAFFIRRHLSHWQAWMPTTTPESSGAAQNVMALLQRSGALFFDELLAESKLLRTQLEDTLAELVANAHVTADNFIGLRALFTRNHPRWRKFANASTRRIGVGQMDDAGRWSLLKRGSNEATTAVAHIAHVLLQRYGVVFRKLLERETNLPPWRDLLYEFRRLEARDEIHGGRFVSGMSGEQYALPAAVNALRQLRLRPHNQQLIVISAVDPLNLTSVFTPTARIAAKAATRIVYRDGIAVAISEHTQLTPLQTLSDAELWEARNHILRKHQPVNYQTTDNTRPM